MAVSNSCLKVVVLVLAAFNVATAFLPVAPVAHKSLTRSRDVRMSLIGNKLAGLAVGAALGLNTAFLPQANDMTFSPLTSSLVAVQTEQRQGLYKEYTVEKEAQKYENAEGTFKTKEATESNKNKYIAILGVLLVGSAVIPMVQYYWYVKDE